MAEEKDNNNLNTSENTGNNPANNPQSDGEKPGGIQLQVTQGGKGAQEANPKKLSIQQPGVDLSKIMQPKPISYEFNCKNNVFFEAPKNINTIYYSVLILFILAVTWAYFSQVDEITRGDGKVIPSSHVKIVQSLDGGIISKLYIKDGDLVRKGQVLIKLDDTRFGSDYSQNYTQLLSLMAEISRLQAQINNQNQITFPPELNDYPEIRSQQNKLFKSMVDSLKKETESLEKDVHLSEQELNLIMPLVKQGLMSQLERIRLEKQLTEAKSKLSDVTENYKTKIHSDLAEKQSLKSALDEKLKGLKDRVNDTEITAPTDGYINNFKLNTIGGVVKPGIDILEIVPIEEQLMIEAKINPRDRAFIKQDQAATIKFPAYDSSIYGSLDAVVTNISADTYKDEKNNEFYLVRLSTDKTYLLDNPKYKIIPGMAANVNILTGKKTILFYLLRPVTKVKEFALKER